jgi:phosphoglycolate phosphatase-like HAD superfamily hydrolase
MPDVLAPLRNFPKKHDFLVCIDSDGCVFDTVEIKHKECFIPATIQHWSLQPVARKAREMAEFVNIYSRDRGINRFLALVKLFDLLGSAAPAIPGLRAWIQRETKLGSESLRMEVERTGDPDLRQAYHWSLAVNGRIEELVRNCTPFRLVRESLEHVSRWADILVTSTTPCDALRREWSEHGIEHYPTVIAGQELGAKREHIGIVMARGYFPDNAIMIGDAPGDYKAAQANGIHFFPINPRCEEASWEKFFREAAGNFQKGEYTGAYEQALVADFLARLPEHL